MSPVGHVVTAGTLAVLVRDFSLGEQVAHHPVDGQQAEQIFRAAVEIEKGQRSDARGGQFADELEEIVGRARRTVRRSERLLDGDEDRREA